MKITCLIDSLNSGGAQRQMYILATLLKKRGFDVEILIYHNLNFYDSVDSANVATRFVASKNKIHRIFAVRRAIRSSNPDVVISFLDAPNIIAELAGLPRRNYALIVSERSTCFAGKIFKDFLRFVLHSFSDAIVSNSYTQQNFIERITPWLKGRVTTVVNCVDIKTFRPAHNEDVLNSKKTRILAIGNFAPWKNPMTLLSAIDIINRKHPSLDVVVDWYGSKIINIKNSASGSAYFLELKEAVARLSLRDVFRLHDPVKNIVELYQQASVLCLPSIYEGCPNVVCEAMACGKPVLAGRIADNDRLVHDGENGFLFNPNCPEDIASTILRFSSLSADEKKKMGQKSRQLAETMLSPEIFVEKYIALIEKVRNRR
ncbi:MAG: glycosyltransferase family 4 protein [Planctomycetes bacterium]|nr:glycosyltransferase family 4 protein [Planctomycetota bacterium]